MKTGSTTLESILVKYYGASILVHRHTNVVPHSCRGYFIFMAVRNPYVREISRYIHFKSHPWENEAVAKWGQLPFGEYLKKLTWRLSLCGHMNGKIHSDFDLIFRPATFAIHAFVRLEKLHEDLLSLPFIEQTRIKNEVLVPKLNTTPKVYKGVFYSWKDAELLYEKFKCDFDRFGYDKKPPADLVKHMFI